jgi:hypothetical protein
MESLYDSLEQVIDENFIPEVEALRPMFGKFDANIATKSAIETLPFSERIKDRLIEILC